MLGLEKNHSMYKIHMQSYVENESKNLKIFVGGGKNDKIQ